MRIFLLPISTRRTLIYCERVQQQLATNGNATSTTTTTAVAAKPMGLNMASLSAMSDKIVNKANQTWAEWENAEKGWKKKLTVYGNEYVFSRIPFEEWGLKTLPSSIADIKPTEVLYPDLFLKTDKAPGVLEALAKERQGLHTKRMWGSLIALPFTIPVGILPVIPNIPGFYLTFRAYSHFKALFGAKYLEALCDKKLVKLTPSKTLNQMYAAGLLHPSREVSRNTTLPTDVHSEKVAELVHTQSEGNAEDVMLLKRWNGKLLAEKFNLPGMELEIERAVEQVEKSLKLEEESAELRKQADKTPEEPSADRKDR